MALPSAAARKSHIQTFDDSGRPTVLTGLAHDSGFVLVGPDGTPSVLNYSEALGMAATDLDGGIANVDGDGSGNLDGGLA
jgi:hypothetical protein